MPGFEGSQQGLSTIQTTLMRAKLLEWTRAQRFRALSKNVGKVEASEERGHCTGDMAIFLEQPRPSPPGGSPWSLAVQAIYLRTERSQIFDIG